MKYNLFLLSFYFVSSVVFADIKPLFYKAYNFANNDVLNVREKPNFRSKKVGEIAFGMHLERKECIKNWKSKWCMVRPLNYGGDKIQGWVNAKYIAPIRYQEGYVLLKNKKSICDYVLKCENHGNKAQCLVVTGISDNKKLTLYTEWIDYQQLKPASNFSAADDNDLNPEGGFCTRGNYVKEFFTNKKFNELSKAFPNPEFQTVLALLKALNKRDESAIEALIHPQKGIILSALSYFDKKGSQRFSQKNFLDNYQSRVTLNWGQTEAKGDVIKKDLYAYFEDLPKDIPHIANVIRLNDFKNYPNIKEPNLKAYEIYWYLDEKNKEYAYTGLVIILAPYQGKWAVVGISRDYWTP